MTFSVKHKNLILKQQRHSLIKILLSNPSIPMNYEMILIQNISFRQSHLCIQARTQSQKHNRPFFFFRKNRLYPWRSFWSFCIRQNSGIIIEYVNLDVIIRLVVIAPSQHEHLIYTCVMVPAKFLNWNSDIFNLTKIFIFLKIWHFTFWSHTFF